MSPRGNEKNKSRNARRNRRGGRGRGRGGGANGNRGAKSTNRVPTSTDNAAEPASTAPIADNKICPVCAEVAQDWAVGSCMHPVCGNCSLRMRVLYKREACVLCITLLAEVVVVPADSFRADSSFADMLALASNFDKAVGMHFVSVDRRRELAEKRGWQCSTCGIIEASSSKLRQHVRASHNSLYCNLCFSGGTSFVSELSMYALAGDRGCPKLREHTRRNHPMCKFCHQYFLGDDELYAHLQSEHESCSVCERQGRIHEYFRDFEQLETHYASDHFVCPDRGCRGVVFASKVDLQAHEVNRHMRNVPRSARRVRVDLADLASRADTAQELREEQNRQTARRRAFMSSHVVFLGSDGQTNDRARRGNGQRSNDSGASSSRGGRTQQSHRGAHPSQAPANSTPSQSNSTPQGPSAASSSVRNQRAPEDNTYRALALPQNQEESSARSAVLVRRMRSTLDPAEFEQFRSASGQFRDGSMNAAEYYSVIVDAFGVRFAIREMVPELIALLPEADKRSALTTAVTGAASSNAVAAESTIDFPNLEGSRIAAPNLTPTARGPYLPLPHASDFPSLSQANRSTAANVASSSAPSTNAPQVNMSRMFGGTVPSQTYVSQPRRAMQSITNPGSFPSLTGAPSVHQTGTQAQSGEVQASTRTGAAAQRPAHMSSVVVRPPAHPFVEAFPGLRPPPPPAPRDPFPALGRRRGVVSEAERLASEEVVDADVTNRAGAVWGGVSGGARRRRGPGGREPAPLPSGPGGRNVVIDVVQAAAERRKKIEQSALPKVGGGGFGFAWERKKNLKKKREIKSAFASTPGDGAGPSGTSGSTI